MLVCAELGLRPIMMLSVTDAHAESTVTVGASESCQDEGDEASDRRGWLHHLMEAGAAVAAAEPLNPLQLGLIMHEPVLPEEIGLVALTAEPILPSEAGLVIPSIEPLLPEEVGLVVPSDGPALPSEVGLIVPQDEPLSPSDVGLIVPCAHALHLDGWTARHPSRIAPDGVTALLLLSVAFASHSDMIPLPLQSWVWSSRARGSTAQALLAPTHGPRTCRKPVCCRPLLGRFTSVAGRRASRCLSLQKVRRVLWRQ